MLAYNCRDERNHPYLNKSPSEAFSYTTSVNQINTVAKNNWVDKKLAINMICLKKLLMVNVWYLKQNQLFCGESEN